MSKALNNILLKWLAITKRNVCSIGHYYIPVTVKFKSGYEEKRLSVEWWYEQALRHLGYGEGWSPEGMPKRMTYGRVGHYVETHEEFYLKVINHLTLKQ